MNTISSSNISQNIPVQNNSGARVGSAYLNDFIISLAKINEKWIQKNTQTKDCQIKLDEAYNDVKKTIYDKHEKNHKKIIDTKLIDQIKRNLNSMDIDITLDNSISIENLSEIMQKIESKQKCNLSIDISAFQELTLNISMISAEFEESFKRDETWGFDTNNTFVRLKNGPGELDKKHPIMHYLMDALEFEMLRQNGQPNASEKINTVETDVPAIATHDSEDVKKLSKLLENCSDLTLFENYQKNCNSGLRAYALMILKNFSKEDIEKILDINTQDEEKNDSNLIQKIWDSLRDFKLENAQKKLDINTKNKELDEMALKLRKLIIKKMEEDENALLYTYLDDVVDLFKFSKENLYNETFNTDKRSINYLIYIFGQHNLLTLLKDGWKLKDKKEELKKYLANWYKEKGRKLLIQKVSDSNTFLNLRTLSLLTGIIRDKTDTYFYLDYYLKLPNGKNERMNIYTFKIISNKEYFEKISINAKELKNRYFHKKDDKHCLIYLPDDITLSNKKEKLKIYKEIRDKEFKNMTCYGIMNEAQDGSCSYKIKD